MAGIGFFAPLPLAMMLPFMAGQSMIMGDAFGKAYQYGKRKISAMSNEEFNRMDANTLGKELLEDYTQIIPHLSQAVQQSRDFQSLIIRELVEIVKSLPKDIIAGATSPGGTGIEDTFAALLKAMSGGGTDIIPKAFADEGDNPGQKFVSDYVQEARAMPFNLLAGIVEKMLSGKLTQPIERRIAYIQVYKERLPKKTPPDDVGTAIDKSGATGVAKQIATMFNALLIQIKRYSDAYLRELNGTSKPATRREMNTFLTLAKKYNVFVAVNRKSNLQIDTAKSIAARKIIPKT